MISLKDRNSQVLEFNDKKSSEETPLVTQEGMNINDKMFESEEIKTVRMAVGRGTQNVQIPNVSL